MLTLLAPICLALAMPGGPQRATAEDVRAQLFADGDLYSTTTHALLTCVPHGATGTTPRFRLAYMPMRNRIETARLVLEESGVPYEFEVVGWLPWVDTVKQTLPLGKLPVLYDYDGGGGVLAQETAITRFLARSLGLAGRGEVEEATVDSLYQQLWSTLRNHGHTHDGELYSQTALAAAPARSGPRYAEMRRLNSYTAADRSCAALGVFEERLAATGTGFLVGDAVTYVDLALFYVLFELAEPDVCPDFAARFGWPRLGAFLEAMQRRPRIDDYLRSARRMPRYLRPGYTYCAGALAPDPAAAAGRSGTELSAAFLAREQAAGSSRQ